MTSLCFLDILPKNAERGFQDIKASLTCSISELFENLPARSFPYYLAQSMHFSFLAVIAALTVPMSVIATPAIFSKRQCTVDGETCSTIYDTCCGFCSSATTVSIQSS